MDNTVMDHHDIRIAEEDLFITRKKVKSKNNLIFNYLRENCRASKK